MICEFCGVDSQTPLCNTCEIWGVTAKDISPTFADVLTEQSHRIGKGGGRYWGRMGAGILFSDGKSILLLKRGGNSDHKGTWGIPGGRAKEGEAPIETAKRETKEECGSAEGTRIEHFHEKDGAHHFHVYLFAVAKPFEIELSGEHTKGEWIPLDEVKEYDLHPKFKDAWSAYLHAIQKRFLRREHFSEWINKKTLDDHASMS
jgi:8-oxo-dGTP pyrophosphatase MutT (NUDIX family)